MVFYFQWVHARSGKARSLSFRFDTMALEILVDSVVDDLHRLRWKRMPVLATYTVRGNQ